MTERGPMKITAVIPAYNAEKHIARAINSVLKQSRPADEVIVVDDGSTDGTVGVIRSFGDKVILIQQQNAGASAARNAGINAAAGDWIAFLDADDEWLPEMLERQCNLLIQNPDLVWATGNYKICFCSAGYAQTRIKPEQWRSRLVGGAYFTDFFDAFTNKTYGCTDCLIIRKDILQEVGLFAVDVPRANDIDMWFRIAYRYPQIGFVVEPLAIYHMETGDSIASHHMDCDYIVRYFKKHLELADQAGRYQAFRPCAENMLRAWIRSSFFDDRVYDIRTVIHQFEFLFSSRYKCIVYAMTILPSLTKYLFQSLSWISRTFKLRRQTWHPKATYNRRKAASSN
jgi:glycosyltransferase involved in cell wall biosynthesis